MAAGEISDEANAGAWPGLSLEHRHLYTVLSQIDDLQRSGETDFESGLLSINRTSVESVPGAMYAGVTLIGEGYAVSTLAATDRQPTLLDEIQQQVQEGPCLSAAWNQHVIRVDDLAQETRWPRYRDAALKSSPVRSVLSFRLFEAGKRLAALNFYADAVGAFDDESVELGFVFAANTTVAWNALNRESQFRSALASRDLIGQAKGVLMERFEVDALTAFELLRRISQESNTKLVHVAERLLATRRRGD